MKTHHLKIWPEHFQPLLDGVKCAELRRNDRDFRVHDMIVFQEWDPTTGKYTRRDAYGVIQHIAEGQPIPEGYVLLSIARANISHPPELPQ